MQISAQIGSLETYMNNPDDSTALVETVIEWLVALNEQLNVRRPLKHTQLEQILDDILDEFPTLALEDVFICLEKIRKGEIELFEGLSSAKILPVIRDYEIEKYDSLEKIRKNQWKEKCDSFDKQNPQTKESKEDKERIAKLIRETLAERKQDNKPKISEPAPFQLYVDICNKLELVATELNGYSENNPMRKSAILQINEYHKQLDRLEEAFPHFKDPEYCKIEYIKYFPNSQPIIVPYGCSLPSDAEKLVKEIKPKTLL